MKTYIILDLVACLSGFVMLYCLLCDAILLGAAFLWASLILGGISMTMEAKKRCNHP
jgi:hypothetical protein